MVFQSFSSKVYCSGIKVSTKIRFLLSFKFFNKASPAEWRQNWKSYECYKFRVGDFCLCNDLLHNLQDSTLSVLFSTMTWSLLLTRWYCLVFLSIIVPIKNLNFSMLEGAWSWAAYCNNLYSLLYLVFVCTVLQVRADYYLFRGFEFVAKFQVSKFNPFLASITFIQPLIFENQGLYKYKIGNIWVNVS